MGRLSRFVGTMGVLLSCMGIGMTDATAADPENTLYMDLETGRVVIEMRPDLAPKHVERIKTLARQGFYGPVDDIEALVQERLGQIYAGAVPRFSRQMPDGRWLEPPPCTMMWEN